jgi:hypothetical protein
MNPAGSDCARPAINAGVHGFSGVNEWQAGVHQSESGSSGARAGRPQIATDFLNIGILPDPVPNTTLVR